MSRLIPRLEKEEELFWLDYAGVPILSDIDFAWLLGRIPSSHDRRDHNFEMMLIFRAVDTRRRDHMDALWFACEASPALKKMCEDRFVIPLNSEAARILRQSLEYEKNPEPKPVDPPPQARIEQNLAKFENGDMMEWIALLHNLTLELTSTHYGDWLRPNITALPGWHASSAGLQRRIALAAIRYLNEADPENDKWFGSSQLYTSAVADKLNTNTGAIFNYGIDGPGLGANDAYLRNVISSDNARVFSNELGYIFYIDTATDTLVHANIYVECCYLGYGNYDLALSNNQAQFEGTGYFYDFNLNAESFYTLNNREILNIAYVYGAKLGPDGRLFFQPSTNGIDVFDGNLGDLLDRISLPFALSPNYDALVVDGTDDVLVAITGSGDGIAIVDLTSISEPPLLPYDRNRSRRTPRISGRPDQPEKPSVHPSQPLQPSHVVPHVTRPILPYINKPK